METRPGTDRGAGYSPSTSAPPPEKASLIEDFIDIFHSPSSVFARRENASFWLHLIIVTVLAGLFTFAARSVFEQVMDADFSRRMASAPQDPRITPEVLEMQRTWGTRMGVIMMYFFPVLGVIFGALILWPSARIVGAKIGYGQAAMIITLAFIPRLIGYLINTLQVVLTDTTSLTSFFQLTASPARFMDPDTSNRMLMGLLSRLDIFTLWATVLIAIGIATMGKIPRAKAAIAAGVLWLIATIPVLFS